MGKLTTRLPMIWGSQKLISPRGDNSLLRKTDTTTHARSSWPCSPTRDPTRTLSTGRWQRFNTQSTRRGRQPMAARTKHCSRMGRKSSSIEQCWVLEASLCNNSRMRFISLLAFLPSVTGSCIVANHNCYSEGLILSPTMHLSSVSKHASPCISTWPPTFEHIIKSLCDAQQLDKTGPLLQRHISSKPSSANIHKQSSSPSGSPITCPCC